MSKINMANLKKTLYYLKRNGLRDTYLAALERLQKNKEDAYTYEAPTKEVLSEQREQAELLMQVLTEAGAQDNRSVAQQTVTDAQGSHPTPIFSILVPAYHTNADYLRAMIESVQVQSFGDFELIIADASRDDGVERVVREYEDTRIKYLHLDENKGISENTNAALCKATGDYIGLLDHDDVLTPDALYEMAAAIVKAKEAGENLLLLYSDEDKCDETGQYYYEPHKKKDFNLDLLLSNNYICHFMVMEASLMKRLGFRRAYDGAQDFDITLRAVGEILSEEGSAGKRLSVTKEAAICHIPKVLYHWRCHRASTAENPQSKQYAYEAGGRAIADFLKAQGIQGTVTATKHLGFYQVSYEPDIFAARADVGAVGGRLLDKKKKIKGGIYTKDGTCPYEGLYHEFSGYMHRASLMQDAEAVDVRLMKICPKLRTVVEETVIRQATEQDYRAVSIRICKAIKAAGYRIVWDPAWEERKGNGTR